MNKEVLPPLPKPKGSKNTAKASKPAAKASAKSAAKSVTSPPSTPSAKRSSEQVQEDEAPAAKKIKISEALNNFTNELKEIKTNMTSIKEMCKKLVVTNTAHQDAESMYKVLYYFLIKLNFTLVFTSSASKC